MRPESQHHDINEQTFMYPLPSITRHYDLRTLLRLKAHGAKPAVILSHTDRDDLPRLGLTGAPTS